MAIRMTGMTSGLDTEALVSALVSSYRTKTEKYTKAQTKLTWKQDAWSSLSAKILSFRSSVSSLRFSTAYNLKTTSVSNSTKASITASNNAVNGTQTLNITQLAKSGYLTGGRLSTSAGTAATTSTKLSDLNTASTTSGTDGTIRVNGKEISVTGDTTISSLVNSLTNAGVNASFDATNQRIFISSKNSGADNDFTLTAMDEGGANALKQLGLYTSSKTATDLYAQYTKYSTDASGSPQTAADILASYENDGKIVNQAKNATDYLQLAKDYISAKQNAGYKKVDDLTGNDKTLAENLIADTTQLVYKSADGSIETYTKTTDANGKTCYQDKNGDNHYLKEVTGDDGKKTKYLTDDENADASTGKPVSTANEYLEQEYGLKSSDISQYKSAKATIESYNDTVNNALNTGSFDVTGVQNAISGITDFTNEAQVKDAQNAIQEALDAINNNQDRIDAQKVLDDNSLIASYIKDYAAGTGDAVTSLANRLDYAQTQVQNANDPNYTGYTQDAVRINGQDAKIYLNGAEFTSSSNAFTINGLTINALATTTTEDKIAAGTADEDALTITTSTDSQGIYDQIKDFLSEYNSIINTMTSYYNADSSSDYEPLTDDEKEAMTDSQIEKWEEKGKSGILRRDTTLSSIMSVMTNAMAKSYSYGGKNYALSSFGIKTLGILTADANEQNAYHIDGDEDDDDTKGNTDKLMAAIISNPEGVTSFFQQLATNLYDGLGTKMTSTSLRTYGTFYNDKEMAKEYSDYTTTISTWETRLSDLEESYYKKFAAMESALTALQSSSSSLSSLLG